MKNKDPVYLTKKRSEVSCGQGNDYGHPTLSDRESRAYFPRYPTENELVILHNLLKHTKL